MFQWHGCVHQYNIQVDLDRMSFHCSIVSHFHIHHRDDMGIVVEIHRNNQLPPTQKFNFKSSEWIFIRLKSFITGLKWFHTYISKRFLSKTTITTTRLMTGTVQWCIESTPSGVMKNIPFTFRICQIIRFYCFYQLQLY